MKVDKKTQIIISVTAIVILLIIVGLFLRKENKKIPKIIAQPTETIIPTVDNSVKVELNSIKKGEVSIIVSNEPKNTDSIEFELSYSTINTDISEGGGAISQGAIGKCSKANEKWECGELNNDGSRKIILGTCSSGVCRYHNIIGPVKITLMFSGNYGQKIFEKEYKLED